MRTMRDYFLAKASLFTPERSRRGIVCVDDEWGQELAGLATVPVTTLASLADVPADWRLVPDEADPAAFTLSDGSTTLAPALGAAGRLQPGQHGPGRAGAAGAGYSRRTDASGPARPTRTCPAGWSAVQPSTAATHLPARRRGLRPHARGRRRRAGAPCGPARPGRWSSSWAPGETATGASGRPMGAPRPRTPTSSSSPMTTPGPRTRPRSAQAAPRRSAGGRHARAELHDVERRSAGDRAGRHGGLPSRTRQHRRGRRQGPRDRPGDRGHHPPVRRP